MTEHWEQIFNTFFQGRSSGEIENILSLVSHLGLGGLKEINKYKTRTNTRLTSRTAMIKPKRPIALPKISTIRILTKSAGLAASERAAPDPTWKTKEEYYWSSSPITWKERQLYLVIGQNPGTRQFSPSIDHKNRTLLHLANADATNEVGQSCGEARPEHGKAREVILWHQHRVFVHGGWCICLQRLW